MTPKNPGKESKTEKKRKPSIPVTSVITELIGSVMVNVQWPNKRREGKKEKVRKRKKKEGETEEKETLEDKVLVAGGQLARAD